MRRECQFLSDSTQSAVRAPTDCGHGSHGDTGIDHNQCDSRSLRMISTISSGSRSISP